MEPRRCLPLPETLEGSAMADVSRRDIDPESLLDYCRRGSDLGLSGDDEFHSLLALLRGSQPPPQELPISQVELENVVLFEGL